MTATTTADQQRTPAFTASRDFAGALQQVHVDLIELHVQGEQAHGNGVGLNFLRGLTPDGRSLSVAEQTRPEPVHE